MAKTVNFTVKLNIDGRVGVRTLRSIKVLKVGCDMEIRSRLSSRMGGSDPEKANT